MHSDGNYNSNCITVFFNNGAGERNRTPDRLITNQLLYLLSYASLDQIEADEHPPRLKVGQFRQRAIGTQWQVCGFVMSKSQTTKGPCCGGLYFYRYCTSVTPKCNNGPNRHAVQPGTVDHGLTYGHWRR